MHKDFLKGIDLFYTNNQIYVMIVTLYQAKLFFIKIDLDHIISA